MKAVFMFVSRMFVLLFALYFIPLSLVHYFSERNFQFDYPFIFGLIMAVSLTLFHGYRQIREVKKLHAGPLRTQDFEVHQVLTLQLPLTKHQILQKLQTNFPSKEWEMQEEANVIKLKTNYSWKSYGEKVRIKVNQLQENLSEVVLESRPKNPLTLWDFGKNQENIIFLRNLLTT